MDAKTGLGECGTVPFHAALKGLLIHAYGYRTLAAAKLYIRVWDPQYHALVLACQIVKGRASTVDD